MEPDDGRLSKTEATITTPSWAKYISALKAQGADKNVLHSLDQMRELHRNPINHPDMNLTTDEAMMLVGLGRVML